jgi:AmpD protein
VNIVIHNISLPPGVFDGDAVIDLFTNQLDWDAHPYYQGMRGLRVSAHFFIRRDGSLIQFVPCSLRAWHAGISNWQGRECCNDFSIGIELEGTDDLPFTEAQYAALTPRHCWAAT